jgi:hypothetical protein
VYGPIEVFTVRAVLVDMVNLMSAVGEVFFDVIPVRNDKRGNQWRMPESPVLYLLGDARWTSAQTPDRGDQTGGEPNDVSMKGGRISQSIKDPISQTSRPAAPGRSSQRTG